jgi:hypothetical protein
MAAAASDMDGADESEEVIHCEPSSNLKCDESLPTWTGLRHRARFCEYFFLKLAVKSGIH